jgi:hypothetical protein
MAVSNWKTRHMVGHYNPGNVDALRERLTRVRQQATTVTRLRDTAKQQGARSQAAGSYTAAPQQPVAADGATS